VVSKRWKKSRYHSDRKPGKAPRSVPVGTTSKGNYLTFRFPPGLKGKGKNARLNFFGRVKRRRNIYQKMLRKTSNGGFLCGPNRQLQGSGTKKKKNKKTRLKKKEGRRRFKLVLLKKYQ